MGAAAMNKLDFTAMDDQLVTHEHYFFRQGLFELKRLFQTTGKPDWDNFLGRLDWLVARSGS